MKRVVVTGTSSGIGHAVAQALLKRGFAVFGSVRREEDATRLAGEFGPRFTPLLFDVTREDRVYEAVQQVREQNGGEGLWGLVNNAGLCRPGPLSEISSSMVREHLETNVLGVFQVTRAFLPLLKGPPGGSRPPGRIVNISSVSGRIAYPFMGAYAASKHALEALSDAWRRELMPFRVPVIVIQPGPVNTRIWDKASSLSTDFSASAYGPILEHVDLLRMKRGALPVEWAARVVVRALCCRRPRTRYTITRSRLLFRLAAGMPDRWLDRLAALKLRRLGKPQR